MKITIGNPVLESVGSASDGDPAAPPSSFGPISRIGQCNDGPSSAIGVPISTMVLSATAEAVTGINATQSATANAKASAIASLKIEYSCAERLLLFLKRRRQLLAASVDFRCLADINNGPNRATFGVFITAGPAAAGPIATYQATYDFIPVPGQPGLDVNKNGGRALRLVNNPDQLVDQDPGLTFPIDPGNYTLRFEINAQCTADGKVVLTPFGMLKLVQA